jgi:hypothetical protein
MRRGVGVGGWGGWGVEVGGGGWAGFDVCLDIFGHNRKSALNLLPYTVGPAYAVRRIFGRRV